MTSCRTSASSSSSGPPARRMAACAGAWWPPTTHVRSAETSTATPSACRRRSSRFATRARIDWSTSRGASCPSSRSASAGRRASWRPTSPIARPCWTASRRRARSTVQRFAPRSSPGPAPRTGSTEPMLLGIDHVVIACRDPDEAAAALESRVGLAATGGGRHEALGTVNRLVWLGDAYLELVGVFDEELAARSWFGQPVRAAVAERDGGLVTWAVSVDDLDETLRWAPPDSGLVGPLDGDRRRPDGRVVRWRLARPEAVSAAAPFLIEHDRAAAEWTPPERAARAEE